MHPHFNLLHSCFGDSASCQVDLGAAIPLGGCTVAPILSNLIESSVIAGTLPDSWAQMVFNLSHGAYQGNPNINLAGNNLEGGIPASWTTLSQQDSSG